MSIEKVLELLSELDTEHYLIVVEDDGYPSIYRPALQDTRVSCSMLKAAVEAEIEIATEIHSIESIQ